LPQGNSARVAEQHHFFVCEKPIFRQLTNSIAPQGANRPQDAIYPTSQKDAAGSEYDGACKKYVMHFNKGDLPPVNAFWSLTMYDKDYFFAPNPMEPAACSILSSRYSH
jgi:hypothetical protein